VNTGADRSAVTLVTFSKNATIASRLSVMMRTETKSIAPFAYAYARTAMLGLCAIKDPDSILGDLAPSATARDPP
jgi:hypothetical protein